MTKEEAIEVYNGLLNKKIKEAFEVFAPELRENEDERIRKKLIDYMKEFVPFDDTGEVVAWLEKQKEQKPTLVVPKFHVGDKVISTKNEHLTYEILEVGHINELGNPDYQVEIFDDGKRGVNGKFPNESPNIKYIECQKMDEWGKLLSEQKPAEWSEEDEQMMEDICSHLMAYPDTRARWQTFLKSLRPQPKREWSEDDNNGLVCLRSLALNFMHYLNANRPKGKMCLSNGECADIEKAFIEHDWGKIIRYANKYKPHWKPSEEQIETLGQWLKDKQFDGDSRYVYPIFESLYEQLKKL